MRTALVTNDFDVRPWVRAMLTHPAFYTDHVKTGLVRTPVDYVVALLHATGKHSAFVNADLADGRDGPTPAVPAERVGWRPNGYWVNASAMEGRARTAQSFVWAATRTYWEREAAV